MKLENISDVKLFLKQWTSVKGKIELVSPESTTGLT